MAANRHCTAKYKYTELTSLIHTHSSSFHSLSLLPNAGGYFKQTIKHTLSDTHTNTQWHAKRKKTCKYTQTNTRPKYTLPNALIFTSNSHTQENIQRQHFYCTVAYYCVFYTHTHTHTHIVNLPASVLTYYEERKRGRRERDDWYLCTFFIFQNGCFNFGISEH